ncbi:hypothetical protein RUM44_000790 [Polyplax serrata]
MFIVYYKINGETPQYILDESPVGSTPLLNYFPLLDSRSLLWLSPYRSFEEYVNEIDTVFEGYKKADENFNTTEFGQCSQAPYGYNNSTPCIFIRINRMISWKPTPYQSDDKLPANTPPVIEKLIKNSSEPRIWVYCEGTTAKDRDHMKPDFYDFQGSEGFNASGFPYTRQHNYVDPIVSIMLKDLPKKIIFSFTCSAWSKNVDARKTQVDVNFYFE